MVAILARRVSLFLMLLMLTPALWADVRASLDRNNIYDGETVTLVIETNGKDMGVEPDLSVLEKDFSILGKSSSRRLQFINGKRSDQHQWQIELDPLRQGTLTVPAIPVGNSTTSPLTLKVSEQPVASSTGSDQAIFIKAEVDDESSSAFVQQQIHYIVRMYYRVPLVEGTFSDLEITNALIERLGEDKQYQATLSGQNYRVLERHYAIFPEKSGPLTIPGTAFTGRVAPAAGRRSGSRQRDSMMERFLGGSDPFSRGKRIRVRNKPLTLDIKPRPKQYTARHWLPSADLVLQDSWEQGPPEFRVGEPVTRTITLQAKGLESSHLPDINIPETDNMRVYPEQAVTENRTDGSWVFGIRKQSIAFVPSRAGRISLPEVRMDWWDTAQQRQRSTVLPAWEVNVLPAPTPQSEEAPAKTADATASTVQETAGSGKLWLTGGLLALLAVLLFLYRKRLQLISGITQTVTNKPKTYARRELQQACEQNNPQTAARSLLDWAAGEWPNQSPRNLGALAHYVDKGADEIHELDRALYAAENSPWNGQALWEIFIQGLHDGKIKDSSFPVGSLPPLYPCSRFSNSTHQL